MKRILLTGAGGFIGRNIKEQLGERYRFFAPTSGELDLSDGSAVTDYLKKHGITDVIHSATINQNRRERGEGELEKNLLMFYNFGEHKDELDKIIYFGSGAEFDKRKDIISANEKDFGNTIPMLNAYALSKYMMNLQARSSENIYNLRLFGVFGKYENPLACFPSHLCMRAIEGMSLTIRQNCVFDFMHIDDLMKPLEWVLENKPKHRDYNVCSGNKISLLQMAKIVREISGKDLAIEIANEGNNFEYTGDNTRLLSECEMTVTPMRQAMKKLYGYYCNQYNKNR